MELSMKDLKELLSMNTGSSSSPEERLKNREPELGELIGKDLLIRTVTMTYTGKLLSESEKWLVLEKAAWIPDSGRWHIAARDAEFSEVEMYPEDKKVYVAAGAITDFVQIPKLPTETK